MRLRVSPHLTIAEKSSNEVHIQWGGPEWAPLDGAVCELYMKQLPPDAADELAGLSDKTDLVLAYQGREAGHVVRALEPAAMYIFRLKMVLGAADFQPGRGRSRQPDSWSPPVCVSMLPGSPKSLCCTRQDAIGRRKRSVLLKWDPPEMRAASRRIRYQVDARECSHGTSRDKGEWHSVWRGSETHCTVGDLDRGTLQEFRVCAATQDGDAGAWSDVLRLRVKSAVRLRDRVSSARGRRGKAAPKQQTKPHKKQRSKQQAPNHLWRQYSQEDIKHSWVEIYDQRSGGFFWKNKLTGQVTTETPADVFATTNPPA